MPGLIRASFGLYNSFEEVDILIDALKQIIRGDYTGKYLQDKATGEYSPVGWKFDFNDYYHL
jgi:hypothetical protein